MLKIALKSFILTFVLFLFSSCSTSMFVGYKASNLEKNRFLDSNTCDFKAVDSLSYKEDEITDVKDPIYNGNYFAYQSFLCKHYQNSIKLFDMVEEKYKNIDEANIVKNIAFYLLELTVNDNITPYTGQFYERMLTNTYKAMSYLALKEYDEAGVEIKRALDRQKRNKEEFERVITKATESLKVNPREYSETQEIVNSLNIPAYKAYENYSNPFVSYFAALYYILDGRASNSIDLLKEVCVQSKSNVFCQDYELVNNNFATKRIPNKIKKGMQISKNNKYIWVIYENGKSKSLEEFNLVLPIIFIKKSDTEIDYKIPFGNDRYLSVPNQIGVYQFSFSIAILGDSKDAYNYLMVNNQKTQMLSNMDNIIGAEYKATLLPRISKSFVRAIGKTMMSAKANKDNIYAGLGVDLLNIALNHSDIRYFIGLPKNYQAIRVANNGYIKIQSPNNQVLLDKQLENKHYVIVFKTPTIGTNYYEIFEER